MRNVFIKVIFYFGFIFFSFFSFSNQKNLYFKKLIETAKQRCLLIQNESTHSALATTQSWFINLDTIKNLFERDYQASHRVSERVYYDLEKETFLLPFKNDSTENHGLEDFIPLTENFITNVIIHIELALERDYADYIHFSDMGHSHVLIPNEYYKKEIANENKLKEIYKKILNYKGSKFLYHTAERLKMTKENQKGITLLDDDYLKHRYLTRNIVGDNKQLHSLEIVQVKNLKEKYNTVKSLENYRWWGAGYYLYSNENGCFSYRKAGKLYYFDISLQYPLSVY